MPPLEPTRPAAAAQQNVSAEDLIADFDCVLEAEMGKADDPPTPSPAKQAETKESIESLEDEMKKLLGDLTAKQ